MAEDLTPKQARFVEEYLIDFNATQAAIRAGYSKKTAGAIGSENLQKPEIIKALAQGSNEVIEQCGLSKERVIQELSRLALGDVRKLYSPNGSLKPIHELDDDTAAMIGGIEVVEIGNEDGVVGRTKKVKLWDKNTALTNAMKHFRLLEPEAPPPTSFTFNTINMDQNMLESARRIAYVLAKAGRLLDKP